MSGNLSGFMIFLTQRSLHLTIGGISMQIERVRSAIVGCGMISREYMKVLTGPLKIIEVVACCDLDIARAKTVADNYGIQSLSYEEILADDTIEMIINLTNPNAHYSIIKQALEHKKHVYSEKMIAVELEEGKELCELAKKQGVRLGVAPDTFLGGGIQTARYLIDHGIIGEVTSVVASLNRDFSIYGDILPHLYKKGGNIPFDVGCYYLTALASILGPVKKVSGFTKIHNPNRENNRTDREKFLEPVTVESENIMVAALEYESGVLGTFHISSESIVDEKPHLEIYGTKGIVTIGDPNTFGCPVYLKKAQAEEFKFPYTHGFLKEGRGLGTADMAWAIRKNRTHRASMEMGYHVFEMLHSILRSSMEERTIYLESTFERPNPLLEGYFDMGEWGPTVERVLVD